MCGRFFLCILSLFHLVLFIHFIVCPLKTIKLSILWLFTFYRKSEKISGVRRTIECRRHNFYAGFCSISRYSVAKPINNNFMLLFSFSFSFSFSARLSLKSPLCRFCRYKQQKHTKQTKCPHAGLHIIFCARQTTIGTISILHKWISRSVYSGFVHSMMQQCLCRLLCENGIKKKKEKCKNSAYMQLVVGVSIYIYSTTFQLDKQLHRFV